MYAGSDKVMEYLKDNLLHSLPQIASATGLHIDTVRRIVEDLQQNGFIQVEKSEEEKLNLTNEAHALFSSGWQSLPEYLVFQSAVEGKSILDLPGNAKVIGFKWAKKKGWIQIEAGKLVPTKKPAEVGQAAQFVIDALNMLQSAGALEDKIFLDEFYERKWIVKKSVASILVKATGKPFTVVSSFDITTPASDAPQGRPHPLSRLSDYISSVFVQLGFEEMEGDLIQSSFWNFDALFQPQDHPARDLADTFYVEGEAELPSNELVQRIQAVHEKSWKYSWSEKEARRRVLRTHTTALSAQALAQLKDDRPRKYFAIGKVFRNEATDYSHLTEFYQVEGIVAWEKATFRDLLGLLQTFYRRLGFEKIRFRPSYFPYTEPSLEIEVYYEPKKAWLELGGAGIFRPEVSIPLCNRYPVLAWGLSLERPLMILLDMHDVRDIYKNDLDFLKNARVRV